MTDQDVEDLRSLVWEEVARGESSFDEVVEAAVESLDGEVDQETLNAAARQTAIAAFIAHADAQRSWGEGALDPDRLRAAFRSLDTAGIVARADFTCCQNCGFAEISDQVPEGHTPRGFTFCHRQDVDRALHGEGVYLAFGSFADDTAPEEIAVEVVRTLTRHGFEPKWNGELGKRIFVPMTWRVRRHGRLAAYPGRPEPESPTLAVSIQDNARGRLQEEWPMTFADLRAALLDLPPVEQSFFVCVSPSGKTVQGMWQAGERLWVEYPDPGARASFGHFVTVDEALGVLRILTDHDRIALADLGSLTREEWGDPTRP